MDQLPHRQQQIATRRGGRFFSVLAVSLGAAFVLVLVRWNELQSSITVPADTSALVRVFVEQPLAIGILRGAALLAAVLLLFAAAVVL